MPPSIHHASAESSSSRHHLSLRSFAFPIPPSRLTPRLLSPPSSQPAKTTLSRQPRSLSHILRRSTQVNPNILPTTYSGIDAGPPPGTVVGIVLGSVAGFLLLLWLIYTCFGMESYQNALYEEEIIRRRSHSPRRAPSSRSRSEVIEVSRQRSPPRREARRETIIVEETTRRPPPEDDIVEVITEHSPVRQQRSDRRDEYYRHVNPNEFGGGRGPTRKVSRR